ncbi:MAG: hypothetical protein IMZ61_08820 [Planctomycetes bacterium]|nr:hypothetical protein [Planctomycetota bacterium]
MNKWNGAHAAVANAKAAIHLTALIDRHTTPEDLTVFRGMSVDGVNQAAFQQRFGSLQVGDVVVDKGFLSTTLDRTVATKFSKKASGGTDFEGFAAAKKHEGVVFEIRAAKGTHCYYSGNNVREMNFRPGTKLKLVERKTPGKFVFEVVQ